MTGETQPPKIPWWVSYWTDPLIVAGIFIGVLAWIVWLNRRAAACLDHAAMSLTD
jgi:hypothetical protein